MMQKIIYGTLFTFSGLGLMALLIHEGHRREWARFEEKARQHPSIERMFQKKKSVRLYGRNTPYLIARITFFSRKPMVNEQRKIYKEKRIMGALYVQIDQEAETEIGKTRAKYFCQWKPGGYRQGEGMFAQLRRSGAVDDTRKDIRRITKGDFQRLLQLGVDGFNAPDSFDVSR